LGEIQRGRGPKEAIFRDEAVYTMACKAAVKANQKLSEAEIQSLLKKLSKLDNSCTCPHGRPIVVRLTKHEIEKRFKRCL
jgi:DNA mismatch repair protein MutL